MPSPCLWSSNHIPMYLSPLECKENPSDGFPHFPTSKSIGFVLLRVVFPDITFRTGCPTQTERRECFPRNSSLTPPRIHPKTPGFIPPNPKLSHTSDPSHHYLSLSSQTPYPFFLSFSHCPVYLKGCSAEKFSRIPNPWRTLSLK